MMEDGRRGSDGGVGSKSSLTWACRRPCPFMHAEWDAGKSSVHEIYVLNTQ